MRRYRVPLVDPCDQDLADLFCKLARSTSDPDHMMIARKPWSLAKEIAKRMGLEGTMAGVLRANQSGPMDYRRCTIKFKPASIPRVTSFRFDMIDHDLLEEAREKHKQGIDSTRWFARAVLARVLGIDQLQPWQQPEWIDGNCRNCWRSNLRVVDMREKI
jgi:hypothetical protein